MGNDYKDYDSFFAQRLRELMDTPPKTTQEDIAKVVGCSRQTISQYRDGSIMPNIEKAVAIAKYFKVSTDYLLGVSPISTTDTDIKTICEYTGLSETAIAVLEKWNNQGNFDCLSLLNSIIEGCSNNGGAYYGN